MYLKKIELNGFKSFPHKKEITVHGGITGVVGPNGSGKSNIADALRWVLGEQSSKVLRGATMQDVIFNGTQQRARTSYCEVALTFDNADGKLATEYTELCVRRRMYRSGESEYSINETGCRLKDIFEMFRDTGIGREGYSIIGQGRIDEILNSKPVQRRKVFEEAAGIMKYRVRKEEAERNLQKTRDNIVRIDDIIAELELQVGPLEEQMHVAKDYIALRDRLKTLDLNLFLYNYDRTAERIKKTAEQVEALEQEHGDIGKQISETGAEQAEIKSILAALQEEIDTHNAKVSGLLQQQEKLKGDRALLEEKERNNRAARGENGARQAEQQKSIEENKLKIEEMDGKISEINAEMDDYFEAIQQLKNKVLDMSADEDGRRGSIEAMKEEAEQLRTVLQSAKVEYSEGQVRAEVMQKRCDEMQSEAARHQDYTAQLEAELKECEAQLKKYGEQGDTLRNKANECAQKTQQIKAQREKENERLADITRILSEDGSRYKLLADMNEDYEGYHDSVRNLLKRSIDAPDIARRMHGVLAELMNVPKKYEVPLEVILGNALQNIVVDTDEDAKEIISFLRRHDLGRVTFLPAQSLKTRRLNKEERQYLSMPGVLGVASEVIECGEEIRPAVDFLLARTVIVEDMEVAISLMRKADYAFRTVTMQGDFIKPGGVMTGGSLKRTNTGLLSRKRMAEELKESIEKNRAEQEKLQAAIAESRGETEKLHAEQQAAFEELRLIEIACAEVKQKQAGAQKQLGEREEVHASLHADLAEAQMEHKKICEAAEQAQKDAEQLQAQFDALAGKIAETEEKRAADLKMNEETRDTLSKMEVEQAERNNQKSVFLNETEHMRAAIRTAEEAIENAAVQEEILGREGKEIRRAKEELAQQADDAMLDIKNAGAMVQDKLDERERLNEQIAQNEQKAADLAERKSLLIEQKYKLIAGSEKAELTRETMQNKIWEDYGLTYANALEFKDESFGYQNGVREIEEIRERMREMGSVNPNAIEDYARVKGRYDNLTTQREDLVRAGDDLKVVIDDLLKGMTASFKEKFDLINASFKRVFGELFGGGHAEVQLLDADDVMECGIDIIAEPPGKKLQSISLLSGGEKALTAIALLFAMLSINPSPVCLLDEIDAPLDDANLIRLANYLTRLARKLQFIVITHRKPTMAICDTLYGVAMHEKGVSDIVSVRLEATS